MSENIPPGPGNGGGGGGSPRNSNNNTTTSNSGPSSTTHPTANPTNSSNAPNSSTHNSSSSAADQPGRPYYESLRGSLRHTLEKKRRLDEQIAQMEEQIYKLEGSYLEDTALSGNIVRGFDGWVKGVSVAGGGGAGGGGRHAVADERRRGRVREEDRVFSRSSIGWMRAQDGPDSTSSSHAPTPTSAFAPQLGGDRSAAGTPAASGSNKLANNKKKRPQDKEEDDDGKMGKRGKITYARDA